MRSDDASPRSGKGDPRREEETTSRCHRNFRQGTPCSSRRDTFPQPVAAVAREPVRLRWPTRRHAAPAPRRRSQLVDTSHQVSDIQKQIAQLQAKGQSAQVGQARRRRDLRLPERITGVRALG